MTPRNDQAWQMCETVYDLVKCRSWVDRTVDPQRRIPLLLWTAVRRSLEVEKQHDAVSRARSHPSLDDLAREAAAKIARERAALSTVAKNLRTVRDAARHVDRTRDERVQQQRAARGMQQEERQLRSVLLGTSTSASPEHSPTLYRTDRGTWVIQGWLVTDLAALAQMDIPAGEGCVEIPDRMIQFFRQETHGVDHG